MELSIIIVSFNTSELLRKCLNAVYKSLRFAKVERESEVIVIDNASVDDSVATVSANFPKVFIVKNSQNTGFAKANNQGIKAARGKFILLLNSDTAIEKEAIPNLINTLKNDNNIGAVGGKLLNRDLSIQQSAGFFPNLGKVIFWMLFIDDLPILKKLLKPYHIEDKSFYNRQEKVDWVSGACFMFRREVINKAGLLDENIFMYGEEMEWCYRIKKAGFQIYYVPQASILHYKGASTKTEEGGITEEFRSIIFFYQKHKPRWQLAIVRLVLIIGALLRIIFFGIIGKYKSRLSLYAKALKLVG